MSSRAFRLALFGVLIITALGGVLDVMEVDAAQYASMSRDMMVSGEWLQLQHRGQDYLDKPPLHFWLSALSFRLFGVHSWSYKLPSILFAFLGVYATFRFAALHHTRALARLAATFFATSAAFLLMTNDVRCDTILTGSVITAIWLGSAWIEERLTWQLVGCAMAISAGMLAKGPMGAMAPLLALGGEVAFKKRWVIVRDPRLWSVPVLVALALVPMCIGLYEQHGLHGLRFYFWEQSFGRITGENRWKDDSSALYFTHEVLWQTLPWTLFVLAGLWTSLRAILRKEALKEYASITGAVLVFIALSLSHFKLPHYLYVILPVFAVQAAVGWSSVQQRWIRDAQWGMLILLGMMLLLLLAWCFPEGAAPYLIAMAGVALALAVATRRLDPWGRLLTVTVSAWLMMAWALNAHVYPYLLKFQANASAGRWASERGLGEDRFYGMQVSGTALDFYAGHPVRWLSNADEAREVIAPGVVIYTDHQRYEELLAAGLPPKERIDLPNYAVQLLGMDFILPDSRSRAIDTRHLLLY